MVQNYLFFRQSLYILGKYATVVEKIKGTNV